MTRADRRATPRMTTARSSAIEMWNASSADWESADSFLVEIAFRRENTEFTFISSVPFSLRSEVLILVTMNSSCS